MKFFAAIIASASASVYVHPHVHARLAAEGMLNESKSIECFFGCMGDLIRKEIKCSFEFDYESEDYARCMEGPNAEFEECLRADDCIQVDGTCMKRCEPILLEDIQACDDGLASGELSQLDYVLCVNKASLDFSNCWDNCTCEQPYCNCVPPTNASWIPYDVVCYPDSEL